MIFYDNSTISRDDINDHGVRVVEVAVTFTMTLSCFTTTMSGGGGVRRGLRP